MANSTSASALETPFSAPTQALLSDNAFQDRELYGRSLAQRVLELEREIYALKNRQNTLPFPNRLPPEVLSHIFVLHSRQDSVTYDKTRHNISWLKITEVCHHWRTVALQCPTLWSQISLVNPQFTELMLKRSKNVPLSIRLWRYGSLTKFQGVLSEISARSDRIQSLEMSINSASNGNAYRSLLENIGRHAPNLHLLSLSSVHEGLSFDLPTPFDLGVSPSPLKHLKLINVNIEWKNLPLGPSMTYLYLNASNKAHSTDWDTLLGSLAMMPLLETLDLAGLLPSGRHPVSDPIVFANLKTIGLNGPTTSIGALSQRIRVHKNASFRLTFTDPPESVASSINDCIRRVKAAWPLASTSTDELIISEYEGGADAWGCKLELNFATPDEDEEVTMGEASDSDSAWSDQTDDDPASTTSLPHDGVAAYFFPRLFLSFDTRQPRVLARVFDALSEHFDLKSLPAVTFQDDEILTTDLIKGAIATLPRVEGITFLCTPIDDFLRILREDPGCSRPRKKTASGKKKNDTRKPHFFPSLKVVTFVGVDFGYNGESVDYLIEALQRRPAKYQIEEVIFEECKRIGEDEVELIGAELPKLEVDWDGYIDWSEGDSDDDMGMYSDYF